MEHLIGEEEKDGVRLRIMQDVDHASSPRDWDNLGTILYNHRNYEIGDKKVGGTAEAYEYIGSELGIDDKENFEEYAKEIEEKAVILPVFLFDHSGITISTSSASFSMWDSAGWDWGQVGIIYVTLEKLEKELTGEDDLRERGKEILINEIEVFNQFITGDVYGFVFEKKNECSSCKNVTWEHIDSCWGFYGHDWEENGLAQHIPDEHKHLLEGL